MDSRRIKADKSVYGEQCHWMVIARESMQSRRLFRNAQYCPVLSQYNIDHVGIMNARHPYEVLRVDQAGTFFMACVRGEGMVKIDGNWIEIKAGEACAFPPQAAHAFKTEKDEDWEFAWVRYVDPPDKKAVANTQSPTLGKYSSEMLKTSILGLAKELENSPSNQILTCWANLIHHQVHKFIGAQKLDERVLLMLREVTKDLARNWSLLELAQIAKVSDEHLRRLCNEQLGRSPRQQLTFLRISHAKNLVMQTDDSIKSIALQVGYKSQFSFSNAFKKWVGCRPSTLRP